MNSKTLAIIIFSYIVGYFYFNHVEYNVYKCTLLTTVCCLFIGYGFIINELINGENQNELKYDIILAAFSLFTSWHTMHIYANYKKSNIKNI